MMRKKPPRAATTPAMSAEKLGTPGGDKPFADTPTKNKYVSPVLAVPRRSSLSLPQNRKPSQAEGTAEGTPQPLALPQSRGGTRKVAPRRASRGASITEEAPDDFW